MTPEILATIAGILLSLAFSYVPKLNTWYAAQLDEYKKLIMLGLIVLVAAGAYGLSCAGLLGPLYGVEIACDQAGVLQLVMAVVAAAIANQTTYKLTPQSRAVRTVKSKAVLNLPPYG